MRQVTIDSLSHDYEDKSGKICLEGHDISHKTIFFIADLICSGYNVVFVNN